MNKLKSISKWLLAAVMRGRRHEYVFTGEVLKDEITIKMHTGEIYTGELEQKVYKCAQCGHTKCFSDSQDIDLLSKCKRGDCV